MIVVVAPGQGSQTPGFLEPWLAHGRSRELLEQYSQAVGIDLVRHGTESDADTIRDTAVAQPLIVAASLVSWHALVDAGGSDDVAGVAGHSVGEISAAAIAGVLSDDEALRFVSERARAMAEAAAQNATGMSAVIGADPDELAAKLAALDLEAANHNGGGQVVVAGALESLAQLSAEPPARARVIPLQVAGAFHSRYMQPARERLAEVAGTLSPADPRLPLWTNNSGQRVASGADFVQLLVGQVASPVRWDATMESFAADGVTGIIELAPAGALVGLAKRGLKGVPSVAVKTPDDLAAATEMLRADQPKEDS
ncbi:[acyl-carrier-protein] S-malonyltransferase [Diaminobutyricimonas aerilata]|uniref:[acyl-carrier-protein] S-malonyltransferase n=1 Tax=Diaminobutyricimonas aerilata TaxID=1162967 RepID=A0A2M9CJK2_9MICO|nr:ACP S-malonyltransferase [Diaminobutyricimonas aerilata]PJJ72076.1 [acyl-carrier-protein] S-malonyltransferase [Diaminobutyricimonas aerilata]